MTSHLTLMCTEYWKLQVPIRDLLEMVALAGSPGYFIMITD